MENTKETNRLQTFNGAESSTSNLSPAAWWAPRNLPEAMEAARLIADSGMVPKDYVGKPGAVLIAMQMGSEVGLSPMASIQNIAVINGRPSLWGDAMLAVCKAHPKWVSIDEKLEGKSVDDYRAVVTVVRKGEPVVVRTFSVKDAERAGLWKKVGPWTNYPQRMLLLRARSWALRDSFPDALRGIRSAEEESDIVQAETSVVSSTPLVDVPQTGVAGLKSRVTVTPSPMATATNIVPEMVPASSAEREPGEEG